MTPYLLLMLRRMPMSRRVAFGALLFLVWLLAQCWCARWFYLQGEVAGLKRYSAWLHGRVR